MAQNRNALLHSDGAMWMAPLLVPRTIMEFNARLLKQVILRVKTVWPQPGYSLQRLALSDSHQYLVRGYLFPFAMNAGLPFRLPR
jgi:hypothetical protein